MRPRPRQRPLPHPPQRSRPVAPTQRRAIPPREAADVATWPRHQAGWSRVGRHSRRRRPSRLGTFVRALTGALACGLCLLALGMVGMQIWAVKNGYEGPGTTSLSWQLGGGVVAVVLQWVADRRRDRIGALCTFGVFAVVFGILSFWWWA